MSKSTELAKVDDELKVVLDNEVDLASEYVRLAKNAKYYAEEANKVKEQLKAMMGDRTVATIEGVPVFSYERIDRINESDFKKDEPEYYKVFCETVEREELDVDRLKRARPDLWKRFQVRQFKQV